VMWGLVVLMVLAGVISAGVWLWSSARDADAVRLPQPADPFANRQAMMRYHAALRSTRR
jgi:hypothetical protein